MQPDCNHGLVGSRIQMDFGLAAISGLLLALSFPRYGHPALAWVALVPLLVALSGCYRGAGRVQGQSARRAFELGLVTGVIYFVGTIYWTATVVGEFGGLSTPLAVCAMVLLALYLGLYPALAAVITARTIVRAGAIGIWLSPAPWVGAEFLRGYLFGGFPWVPLGNSQVTVLPVAQSASVVGVYGLSVIVALANAGLTVAFLARGRKRWQVLATVTCLMATVVAWGTWRISSEPLVRAGVPISVGLVQGNVPQELKWDPNQAETILATHVALTREAVGRGAQFVLWPESSTPFMFEEEPVRGEDIRSLVRDLGIPLLFGSDQFEREPKPRLYNAAFALGPEGRTKAVYRKMHLVPFGEFIPMKKWFFFASPLVDSLAEFAPGEEPVMIPIGDHQASTAICYEVVYPSLARDAVLAGSELLTTITNDAWYGHSSAPYQHFAMASMRAVEQGRYLVRAANTGISGIVDPYGRVIAESVIFERTAMVGQVRFLTSRTIYSVIGDAVAYAALALSAAMVLLPVLLTRRRRERD